MSPEAGLAYMDTFVSFPYPFFVMLTSTIQIHKRKPTAYICCFVLMASITSCIKLPGTSGARCDPGSLGTSLLLFGAVTTWNGWASGGSQLHPGYCF